MYNPALRSHVLRGVFPYRELPARVEERTALASRDRIRAQFTKLAQGWTPDLNSEWLLRHYQSLKLIMAASVMFASEQYADKRKLRATQPYLIYYGLFHACRAFILTLPSQGWRDGALLTVSHEKAANITVDSLSHLQPSLAQEVKATLSNARVHRELFSYSFPADGPGSVSEPPAVAGEEALSVAALLCELAQLNSEALDAALEHHCPDGTEYVDDILEEAFQHRTASGALVLDDEDWYRIGQLARHFRRPVNLWMLAREGMVEDFFPPWGSEDGDPDDFDANAACSVLFPFP